LTFVITGTWWNATPDLYDRIRRGRETGWSWVPLLFDAYYPLAAGVVDREITPRQFTRERIFDRRIQSLLGRIRLEHDADMDAALLRGTRFGAEVTISMKDGRRFSKATPEHRGGPGNPIDAAEKFAVATRDVLDDARREAIIETVGRIDRLKDVRELTALLA
jgi:2-methylcitrate dehydratase PrpD